MPERLVSTTCLGNLNDPSYELLLRRKLGGVFEVDELLLDWDQADVCAFVGVTELGRTVDVRLDTADGCLQTLEKKEAVTCLLLTARARCP